MIAGKNPAKQARETIPERLVGQAAVYQVIKKPHSQAYPHGNEARYEDDYLRRLNEAYNLTEIPKGKIRQKEIWHLVMGSPLNNMEGEGVLAWTLRNSVQAGSWQPFIIDVAKLRDADGIETAEDYLKAVDAISPDYNRGMMEGGVLFGLAVAKRGKFILPTKHETRVIAIPSQRFIEYVIEKRK